MVLDETIQTLSDDSLFPFQYGYSCVGRVIEIGPGVDESWLDKVVFAFHPHQSHFVLSVDQLIRIPEGMRPESATLLPNMESAINFVHDGHPLLGEHILVFGQGIVGLLTTALLSHFPFGKLITLDNFPHRRNASVQMGAEESLDPSNTNLVDQLAEKFAKPGGDGSPDLVFELSGNPDALDQAIAVSGFHGRIVIGSWYGQKVSSLHLGATFHRNRIQLISSQVSSLNPVLTGRWQKLRRLNSAKHMLNLIDTDELFTHRFSIAHADNAFELLDNHPDSAIQVLLTYDSS
jgi:threonine dehydrogenase-like Zn-dependent dehydrogenase